MAMNELYPTPRILVVGKESSEIKDLLVFLREHSFEVFWAKDGESGYTVLDAEEIAVMITELQVHRIDGMRLLRVAKERNPEICVIMIANEANIELATEAMRQGAYDFQTMPLNKTKLLAVIERAISHQRLVLEVSALSRRLDKRFGFHNLVGNSKEMVDIYKKIEQIAPTRSTVLIVGETGTGKNLIAQTIHQNSTRKNAPFVKLNCASLAEGIIESELFGHEKGAFTGALKTHRGRFEIADGGTLFLDEVSEISLSTQAKLLRVLEEREFERVGGTQTFRVDVRLIAATNKDLETLIQVGKFREDLYYRLKVVTLKIPPLRERKQDIPLLVDMFIRECSKENDKDITGISRGAMDLLLQYHWPGNIRELKNCIEGMVALSPPHRMLDVSDLPEHIVQHEKMDTTIHIHVGMSMEEIEKIAIKHTLQSVGYDKHKAAAILGIGLRTLYRKQKQYQIV